MATTTDHPGVIARPPFLFAGALFITLVLRWFRPLPIFEQLTA